MGYSTIFNGELKLSRPATETEMNYINKFSGTRRVKRDVNKLMQMFNGEYGHPTPINNTPEGIYGNDGAYFIGGKGFAGQDHDESVIGGSTPPGQLTYKELDELGKSWSHNNKLSEEGLCQPGLWCQWILRDEETLAWDEGEKFYEYINWLKYLINHFFAKWGIELNGEIYWDGEDCEDKGLIVVENNNVIVKYAKIIYE